jgi:hypothetical protein
MLSTALINTLGVATWYLLGAAYISLSVRYWPKIESMRGKWLPSDILHSIETDDDFRQFRHHPRTYLVTATILTFLMLLTIWPYTVYCHAKRGFRTENDTKDKSHG